MLVISLQRLHLGKSCAMGDTLSDKVTLLSSHSNVSRTAGAGNYSLGHHQWVNSSGKGLLVVGTGRLVSLYDVHTSRYISSFSGHGARVGECVWIPRPNPGFDGTNRAYLDEDEIVSCATDGTVRVWNFEHRFVSDGLPWKCTSILGKTASDGEATSPPLPSGCSAPPPATLAIISSLPPGSACSPVNSVGVLRLVDGSTIIAACTLDCAIRVWYRPSTGPISNWIPVGELTIPSAGLLQGISLSLLPGMERQTHYPDQNSVCLSSYGIILAVGGADNKIHLCSLKGVLKLEKEDQVFHDEVPIRNIPSVSSAETSIFVSLSLSGHSDWIKSVVFSAHTQLIADFGKDSLFACRDDGFSPLYLVSVSNDGKGRLWKLRLSSLVDTFEATTPSSPDAQENDVNDSSDEEFDGETDAGQRALSKNTVKTASMLASTTEFERLLLAMDEQLHTISTSTSNAAMSTLHRSKPFVIQYPKPSEPYTFLQAEYDVHFDALLSGHEDFVNSVRWHPVVEVRDEDSKKGLFWCPPCVLTVSVDKALGIWQASGTSSSKLKTLSDELAQKRSAITPDELRALSSKLDEVAWGGVWTMDVRLGSAGAASLGLFGVFMNPTSTIVTAYGYHGALQVWKNSLPASAEGHTGFRTVASLDQFSLTNTSQTRIWISIPAATGHFAQVAHVSWANGGRYLVSCSADFTTRVWSTVSTSSAESGDNVHISSIDNRSLHDLTKYQWVEISRPMIHGHEMTSLIVSPMPYIPHRLFAGADEKVLRVYDAPVSFQQNMAALNRQSLEQTFYAPTNNKVPLDPHDHLAIMRSYMAYLPELGLTNKRVQVEGEKALDASVFPSDAFTLDGRDATQREYHTQSVELMKRVEQDEHPAASSASAQSDVSSSSHPPTINQAMLEDDLVVTTRWTEIDKLYGHTSEIACVTVDTRGGIIATSGKSRSPETSFICLWDAITCGLIQNLDAHRLTVEDMVFSNAREAVKALDASCISTSSASENVTYFGLRNTALEAPEESIDMESDFLFTVGRDRQMGIFARVHASDKSLHVNESDIPITLRAVYRAPPLYQLVKVFPAHSRQIWSVAAAPLPTLADLQTMGFPIEVEAPTALTKEGGHFQVIVTGARDQALRVWGVSSGYQEDVEARAKEAPEKPSLRPSVRGNATVTEGLGVSGFAYSPLDPDIPLTARETIDSKNFGLVLSSITSTSNLSSPVTSIAFAPITKVENNTSIICTLAVGQQCGKLSLFELRGSVPSASGNQSSVLPYDLTWALTSLLELRPGHRHVDCVRSMDWRPLRMSAKWKSWRSVHADDYASDEPTQSILPLELATASDDGFVHVLSYTP